MILLNYLFVVDAYSKITKLYGIKNIPTEEVIDKLDMFQSILGKLYELVWWYMKIIQTETGT